MCALAINSFLPTFKPDPNEMLPKATMRGRVTRDMIYVYQEPDLHSPRLGTLRRDTLVDLYELIKSTRGPTRNPRWYALKEGYAHSTYLQRIETAHLNQPTTSIPEGGQLGEVTVPIAQSLRHRVKDVWEPLYRLYYESVFWITSLDEGPDGQPWYGLTDDRLRTQYHIPAAFMRLIPNEELAPISPEIPDEEKRLNISLKDQTVFAYESDRQVFEAQISSGAMLSGTPRGTYRIQVKRPSRHMGDGRLTTDLEAYELPGVPWVSYFTSSGIAFHGAYWHDNFGSPISHGCVNMRNPDALWVYRWSNPIASPTDWHLSATGTRINIE